MKSTILPLTLAALVSIPFVSGARAPQGGRETDPLGRVVTLYAHDPILHSIDLRRAEPGHVVQDFELRVWRSHLDFDNYREGGFTVGVQGGDEGCIVDVGSESDLRANYGIGDWVDKGYAFASIHLEGGRVTIRDEEEPGEFQAMEGVSSVVNGDGCESSAAIVPGHVYLLRVDVHDETEPDLLAKLLVLSHVPGESVTFRWQLLGEPESR